MALDENEKITTKVYRGSNEKNVVIKAAGDVWMTHEQLDDLGIFSYQKAFHLAVSR